jgi:DNA repair protein RecO (recombination protein O)
MAIEWQDDGIVLGLRGHGEADGILTLLTEHHGRHAGLVKGGSGQRHRSILQTGNLVQARWRARLEAHLGSFVVEPARSFAGAVLGDRRALTGLAALCAMVETVLPEREPHPAVFAAALELLSHLGDASWPAYYVLWEFALLREMGYGLDLRDCAATGSREDLAYVSPRSGRAVSRVAAEPYRDRLFALPTFLQDPRHEIIDAVTVADLRAGLALTGHFLERNVFAPHDKEIPPARTRFVELVAV